jgi:Penicillin-insensitive murein endopeptidase
MREFAAKLPLLLVLTSWSGAWARPPGLEMDTGAVDTGFVEGDVLELDDGPPDSVATPSCQGRAGRFVELPERDSLFRRASPDASMGTRLLVDTIVATGEQLAWQLPQGSPFVVGDLSRPGGGRFGGHKSHDAGLDADIGIYATGGSQGDWFADLDARTFDPEANWLLIRGLIDTGNVQRILLDRGHIQTMRTWLAQEGVLSQDEIDRIFPPDGTPRLWEMDGIVRHAANHRNHLHLTVICEQ